jgi:hypothetical protein
MNRSSLRRLSARRLVENRLYQYRRKLFLLAHPYCQVWCAEHGVAEEVAIRQGGRLPLDGAMVSVPLSTEIHHVNKRRGADLLDPRFWLAVSAEAHRRIEDHKDWARARGYLRDF